MAQRLLTRIVEATIPRALWRLALPLFRPGLPRRAAVRVTLTSLPATEADIQRLAACRGRVAAVIPEEACLERRMTLPRAARSRAEKAVALQMRASLPMEGRNLVWRIVSAEEMGDRLGFRMLICKGASITDLELRARSAGVNLAEIRLAVPDAAPLWEASPQSGEAARNWAAATGLGVALIALLTVVVTEMRARDLTELADARAGQVDVLRSRLARAAARRDAAVDGQTSVSEQLSRFSAGARPLAYLSDIASALPADVWLSEVTFADSQWRLSGFTTTEVTNTITALQSLPWARNVRLDGPVSFDNYSSQNRFDVVLQSATGEDR